jgi:hypothetical protein
MNGLVIFARMLLSNASILKEPVGDAKKEQDSVDMVVLISTKI